MIPGPFFTTEARGDFGHGLGEVFEDQPSGSDPLHWSILLQRWRYLWRGVRGVNPVSRIIWQPVFLAFVSYTALGQNQQQVRCAKDPRKQDQGPRNRVVELVLWVPAEKPMQADMDDGK